MSHIIRFNFPRLWNSEYPLVVTRIIDIVAAYNPKELHFENSFDRLAAFRPQLDKIEIQEKFDKDSVTLSELDQERNKCFSIIYTVVKAFVRTSIVETANHANCIMTVLKKHGSDIVSANYTAKTERLYNLTEDISSMSDAIKALEKLSLLPLFEQMKERNTAFDNLFMQRNQRQAETERIDVRTVRIECDKAITQLWNAIEFCSNEYGEEQYLPLLNVVNNFNSYYRQQLAARATHRKANKTLSTEEPIELI